MPVSTDLDDLRDELSKLTQEAARLESLLAGWTRGGGTTPNLDYYKADWGEFVYPPFESAGFRRASTQAISSGVWSTVVFDEVEWNTGVIGYSTATGLFNFLRPSDKRVYLIQGRAEYNLNTGNVGNFHSIEITSYPSTTDIVMSKLNWAATVQTFFYLYQPPNGSTGFSLQILEDGSKTLTAASFSMWEVGRL